MLFGREKVRTDIAVIFLVLIVAHCIGCCETACGLLTALLRGLRNRSFFHLRYRVKVPLLNASDIIQKLF